MTTTRRRATQATAGASANISAAQQSLVQNYNTVHDRLQLLGRLPDQAFVQARRLHLLAGQDFDHDLQPGIGQPLPDAGLPRRHRGPERSAKASSPARRPSASHYNHLDSPYKPRNGKEMSLAFQIAGLGGNVRYFTPFLEYKQFMPMKGLKKNMEGRNVLGYRLQAAYVQGYGGDVAPPTNRFYTGGEGGRARLRRSRSYSVRVHPDARALQPHQSRRFNSFRVIRRTRSSAPSRFRSRSTASSLLAAIPPSPATSNTESRSPGPVTFAFFDDFNIDVARAQVTAATERRRRRHSQRSALWLPDLHQRCLPGWTASCIQQPDPADLRNQSRAAHVLGRGTPGHSADRQCARSASTTPITRCASSHRSRDRP